MKKQVDIIYKCPRCKIQSGGKSMCPCPRGGCEAIPVEIPKRSFTRKQALNIAINAALGASKYNEKEVKEWFDKNF